MAEQPLRARLAYIGLGGNLNAPDRAIRSALDGIQQAPGILRCRVSSLWRTLPVDSSGPDYCNAVAEVCTTRHAREILSLLHEIEHQHGRVRTVRNAPRTLDLDLIAIEKEVLTDEALTLPHPRAHQRAFVLLPLCELDPGVLLGPAGALETASQWKERLSPQALSEARLW